MCIQGWSDILSEGKLTMPHQKCLYFSVKKIQEWGFVYLPSLLYDLHLVCIVGASLSEPHIDGTAGRIIVRPSPARRGWSHEVCRASVTVRASPLCTEKQARASKYINPLMTKSTEPCG